MNWMYSLCKCCRNAWSGIIWKQLFGQGTKNMRRTWSTFPCYLARLGAKICQWLHFGTEILHLHSFIGFSKVLIDFLLVFTDLSMVFIVFFLMMFIDVWMVFIFFHVCLFFPNGCHWMSHDFDIFLFDGFEPFFHGVHRCVHRCVHCCSLLVLQFNVYFVPWCFTCFSGFHQFIDVHGLFDGLHRFYQFV